MAESIVDQPQTRKEQNITNFQGISASQLNVRAHVLMLSDWERKVTLNQDFSSEESD